MFRLCNRGIPVEAWNTPGRGKEGSCIKKLIPDYKIKRLFLENP